MPELGNSLGEKSVFTYVSDAGGLINLLLDDDLVISNSGLSLGEAGQPKPLRFKPRVVFAQARVGGRVKRKALVCGTSDSALYATNVPQSFNIDGLIFTTTGRRGETQSFVSNGASLPPTP